MKKLLVLLLFVSFGTSCSTSGSKLSYTESTDGLKSLMTDLYNAQKSGDKSKFSELAQSLRVPDSASWFKKVFGDDKGAKASVQYDTNISQIESELDKVFAKMVGDGQSEIKI